MQISRLKTSTLNGRFTVLALAMSACLGTAVYAGQAKPAAKPAASAAPKATPESIANGETIYKRQCQMCHGATGMGDGPAAKMLKGKLPNLSDKTVMAKISEEDIHDAVENGKKTEIGNMPAFKTKLKPEEIQDVINYAHTLAK